MTDPTEDQRTRAKDLIAEHFGEGVDDPGLETTVLAILAITDLEAEFYRSKLAEFFPNIPTQAEINETLDRVSGAAVESGEPQHTHVHVHHFRTPDGPAMVAEVLPGKRPQAPRVMSGEKYDRVKAERDAAILRAEKAEADRVWGGCPGRDAACMRCEMLTTDRDALRKALSMVRLRVLDMADGDDPATGGNGDARVYNLASAIDTELEKGAP